MQKTLVVGDTDSVELNTNSYAPSRRLSRYRILRNIVVLTIAVASLTAIGMIGPKSRNLSLSTFLSLAAHKRCIRHARGVYKKTRFIASYKVLKNAFDTVPTAKVGFESADGTPTVISLYNNKDEAQAEAAVNAWLKDMSRTTPTSKTPYKTTKSIHGDTVILFPDNTVLVFEANSCRSKAWFHSVRGHIHPAIAGDIISAPIEDCDPTPSPTPPPTPKPTTTTARPTFKPGESPCDQNPLGNYADCEVTVIVIEPENALPDIAPLHNLRFATLWSQSKSCKEQCDAMGWDTVVNNYCAADAGYLGFRGGVQSGGATPVCKVAYGGVVTAVRAFKCLCRHNGPTTGLGYPGLSCPDVCTKFGKRPFQTGYHNGKASEKFYGCKVDRPWPAKDIFGWNLVGHNAFYNTRCSIVDPVTNQVVHDTKYICFCGN